MSNKQSAGAFGVRLIEEARFRVCDESLQRIRTCLEHLSEEEVWHRPNSETVSVGNLILHLCGNVRQWIIAGLGGKPDKRRRAKEFSERGPIPTAELVAHLEETLGRADAVLASLNTGDLVRQRRTQYSYVSGFEAIRHVLQHFSYHFGQITYAVKALKDVDMGYYAGKDLNATN